MRSKFKRYNSRTSSEMVGFFTVEMEMVGFFKFEIKIVGFFTFKMGIVRFFKFEMEWMTKGCRQPHGLGKKYAKVQVKKRAEEIMAQVCR